MRTTGSADQVPTAGARPVPAPAKPAAPEACYTVCELLTLRERAVVVPRSRPGLEQTSRAQRMAELGLLRLLDPAQLGPATLMHAVQEELRAAASGEARAPLAAMNGLDRVSASLLGWLDLEPQAAHGKAAAWRGQATERTERTEPAIGAARAFFSLGKSWHPTITQTTGASAC